MLKQGWYHPVLKGVDPIGRILMFVVNDYLEIKDKNIPHSYLDEFKDIIFISLTNKIIGNKKNIISAGINASSQLRTIKKFLELNEINKTILLIPDVNYKDEINKGISSSKIKIFKSFCDINPIIEKLPILNKTDLSWEKFLNSVQRAGINFLLN